MPSIGNYWLYRQYRAIRNFLFGFDNVVVVVVVAVDGGGNDVT
jgi:hypothetical protein